MQGALTESHVILGTNARVDLWAGLLGNGNSLLFMMFCRKVQCPPVRAAGLQGGFYKRGERRGGGEDGSSSNAAVNKTPAH